GEGPNADGSYVMARIVAHERRDGAGVQRLGHEARKGGRAGRGPPPSGRGGRRQPGVGVVRVENMLAQRRPTARQLVASRLGIGARVVVRGDVVRVTDVAVPALAVVLPDQLPVRLDEVAPPGGDTGARKSLPSEHRLELGAARLEWRRVVG